MELNVEQIMEYIPHRYPFLFLDRITAYEPGVMIEGYKMVTFNEPFFQGHFPGKPIMPGVLITEALAQLGCVYMCLEMGDEAKTRTPLFMGIDKAKFRRAVTPGVRLDMRVEVVSQRKGGVARVKAMARVGDEVAAEAELLCMMK